MKLEVFLSLTSTIILARLDKISSEGGNMTRKDGRRCSSLWDLALSVCEDCPWVDTESQEYRQVAYPPGDEAKETCFMYLGCHSYGWDEEESLQASPHYCPIGEVTRGSNTTDYVYVSTGLETGDCVLSNTLTPIENPCGTKGNEPPELECHNQGSSSDEDVSACHKSVNPPSVEIALG